AVADMLRRGRPPTGAPGVPLGLTGVYKVTRLGPPGRGVEGGAAPTLAPHVMLLVAAVALAGPRGLAPGPPPARALGDGDDPRPALSTIAWMDRLVLLLSAVIVFLGLAISRR